MKRWWFRLLRSSVLAYVLLCGFMWWIQDSLIFYPTREIQGTPADKGLAFDEVTMTTVDDELIRGWWIPHPQPRATVLFCHGNAGNRSHRLETMQILHDLGCSVLIIDYRGYGGSTGSPSAKGLYKDGDAAIQWLEANTPSKAEDLIIMGRSLGGGVASYLARSHQARGLVLMNTFTSLPGLAQRQMPFLPVYLLAAHRFNNVDNIADYSGPVLISHAIDDEVIPVQNGKTLATVAPERTILSLTKGRHNSNHIEDRLTFTLALEKFLQEVTR